MKKQPNLKSATMLITNVVIIANINFAQTPPPNPAQESLDFLTSPQGTNVNNKVQILFATSLGKIAISNELERVSIDMNLALPVRQSAQEALLTYDSSGTNTFEEIMAFRIAWPFGEETPPPMTTDTIVVMKRGLEICYSGFVQLENILSNTNYPALYRKQWNQLLTNAVNHLIINPQDW